MICLVAFLFCLVDGDKGYFLFCFNFGHFYYILWAMEVLFFLIIYLFFFQVWPLGKVSNNFFFQVFFAFSFSPFFLSF